MFNPCCTEQSSGRMDDGVRVIDGCFQNIPGWTNHRIILPQSRNRLRGFFRWEDARGESDGIDEYRDMARTFEPGTTGESTTFGEGNFPLHFFLSEDVYEFKAPS